MISCKNKNNVNESIVQKNTSIENKQTFENNQTSDALKGNDKHSYSSIKLREIAKRANPQFCMLYDKSKTLSMCCANDEFRDVFGSLEKDSLLKRYRFLQQNEKTYKSFGETYKVTKYYYKGSFIKTFFYNYSKSNEIASSKIVDDSIVLKNKIRIGLSKKEFLMKLFAKQDIDYLLKYDTINIGDDEMGEMDYYYIFEQERLKKILIDTACDWLDKELK